jgi:TetR/AcrR family transcriptional regulator
MAAPHKLWAVNEDRAAGRPGATDHTAARPEAAPRPLPARKIGARNPETIRRIVAAAEKIFAEQGIEGARTEAIARAAGVNKALLYYYFKSKEDLHRCTLQMLFGRMREQVGAAMEGAGSPREQLVRYVNGYFEFTSQHPNYPRLVQREVMGRKQSLRWIVQACFGPLYRRLQAIVRAGIAQGEFRRVDPQNAAVTLIAMTVFYFAAAPVLGELWGCDPLAPARVAARRRSVLDFLEHGLFRQDAGAR